MALGYKIEVVFLLLSKDKWQKRKI